MSKEALLVIDIDDDINIEDIGITYLIQHWDGRLVKAQVESVPLKPLPKNKLYSTEDCVTLEYGKTIAGPNYYYKVGYNHCLGEILSTAGEED